MPASSSGFSPEDVLLSERGIKQVTWKLTRRPEHFKYGHQNAQLCFASPMRRTVVTALKAFGNSGVPIVLDPRLREVSKPCADKATLRCWFSSLKGDRVDLVDCSRTSAHGKDRDTTDTEKRLHDFVADLRQLMKKEPEKHIAIVCHGGVMQKLCGWGTKHMKPWPAHWGSPRGWPINFKPYFCDFGKQSGSPLMVAAKSSRLMLVRHADSSENQRKRDERAEKKARRWQEEGRPVPKNRKRRKLGD